MDTFHFSPIPDFSPIHHFQIEEDDNSAHDTNELTASNEHNDEPADDLFSFADIFKDNSAEKPLDLNFGDKTLPQIKSESEKHIQSCTEGCCCPTHTMRALLACNRQHVHQLERQNRRIQKLENLMSSYQDMHYKTPHCPPVPPLFNTPHSQPVTSPPFPWVQFKRRQASLRGRGGFSKRGQGRKGSSVVQSGNYQLSFHKSDGNKW